MSTLKQTQSRLKENSESLAKMMADLDNKQVCTAYRKVLIFCGHYNLHVVFHGFCELAFIHEIKFHQKLFQCYVIRTLT